MKNIKKYLSLIMAVIMTCCIVQPISAFAEEYGYAESDCKNNTSSSQTEVINSSNGDASLCQTIYKDASSCVPFVQSQLTGRKSSFNFKYYTKTKTTSTSVKSSINSIYNSAISHEKASKSYQGDYLAYSIVSANYSTQYTVKADKNKNYTITVTFTPSYTDTASQETAVANAVKQAISQLNLKYSNEYEKVWRIHQYICSNVNFNENSLGYSDLSAYAAICNKKGTYIGDAALFYRMLFECGVKSRIISSSNWCWNLVKIGSTYYNTDVLLDSLSSDSINYDYFLKSNSFMNGVASHTRSSQYNTSTFNKNYPSSTTDYDYLHNVSTFVFDYADVAQQEYSGSVIEPTFNISSYADSNCYSFSYSNNIKPEYGYVTVNGNNGYFGSSKKSFRIHCDHTTSTAAKIYPATTKSNGYTINVCDKCEIEYSSSKKTIYSPKTLNISKTALVYTGKNLSKPTVKSIVDTNGNAIRASYSVSYISRYSGKAVSSVKRIGYYRVRVTFNKTATNLYSGYIDRYFTVNPRKPAIVNPTTGKNYVIAKWKKDTTATGYQVTVSTSSNFKSGNKTYTIKGNKNVSKKVTGLKKGKKYYVRVREYRACKADGKTYNLYGAYSSVKSIKCK